METDRPALVALDGPVAGRVLGPTVVVGAAPPDPAAVVVGAAVVGAAVVGAAVVGAAVVVGGGATVISRGEPVSMIVPPLSIATTLNTPLASPEAVTVTVTDPVVESPLQSHKTSPASTPASGPMMQAPCAVLIPSNGFDVEVMASEPVLPPDTLIPAPERVSGSMAVKLTAIVVD